MKWWLITPTTSSDKNWRLDIKSRCHGGSFYGLAQFGAPGSLGGSVLRRPLVILSILGAFKESLSSKNGSTILVIPSFVKLRSPRDFWFHLRFGEPMSKPWSRKCWLPGAVWSALWGDRDRIDAGSGKNPMSFIAVGWLSNLDVFPMVFFLVKTRNLMNLVKKVRFVHGGAYNSDEHDVPYYNNWSFWNCWGLWSTFRYTQTSYSRW